MTELFEGGWLGCAHAAASIGRTRTARYDRGVGPGSFANCCRPGEFVGEGN
jgi:hypothetical protein